MTTPATFAVTYRYAPGSAAARNEHRPRHVAFLQAQYDAGRLLTSGPFGPEEVPGALLLLAGTDKAEVAAVLDEDPFHRHGLVAERRILRWNIFFGADRY